MHAHSISVQMPLKEPRYQFIIDKLLITVAATIRQRDLILSVDTDLIKHCGFVSNPNTAV